MMRNVFLAVLVIGCLWAGGCVLPVAQGQAKAPENLLFPHGSPPAATLDVVDIKDCSADDKLLATTLQGLANSGPYSQVYLVFKDGNDATWLAYAQQKGYVKQVNHLTFDEYLRKYADAFDSVIVYDPGLPATINIATMMAPLQKGVVIAPAALAQFKGKDVTDLRGRWKNNVQAYEWALAHLWPQMHPKVLCCFHPTSIPHHLRDYLVRHRIFTFWITSAEAQDGKTSDYEAEKAFAEKLFAKTPANVPVLGFWFSEKDWGINEYAGVGLAGQYGKLTVPCDWTTNMSFWCGISVDFEPLVAQHRRRLAQRSRPGELDRSKVYVCFDIVDSGDAPIYWQAAQYNVWQDPNCGSVPINYSVGPTTMELMPPILQWYYENATPNDYFYMGLSGACYVAPYRDFMSRTADPVRAWDDYLALTQQYMKRLGLHEISLYTDAWRVYDRGQADAITLKFADRLVGLDALILGMGRDEQIIEKQPNYVLGKREVIVSHVITRWDPNNVGRNQRNNEWLAAEIRQHTPKSRPAFVHVHPLSWSYYPSDLLDVAKQLGPEYVPVLMPDFNTLYRKARTEEAQGN